jgi:hypothetical protein
VSLTAPQPMLARLAEQLPVGPQWSDEVKLDLYRCVAVKDGRRITRHSKRATHGTTYPGITAAIASLKIDRFIVDSEAMAVDAAARLQECVSREVLLLAQSPVRPAVRENGWIPSSNPMLLVQSSFKRH